MIDEKGLSSDANMSCAYIDTQTYSIVLSDVLQYYHEPVTGRKFRSRTEVLYYLEHGTSKRGAKKAENTDFHSDVS